VNEKKSQKIKNHENSQFAAVKMFEKLHHLDKSNQIDVEAVNKFIKKSSNVTADSKLFQLSENITNFCFDLVEKNSARIHKATRIDKQKCNMNIYAFMICHEQLISGV
jgi:hypothetical protein